MMTLTMEATSVRTATMDAAFLEALAPQPEPVGKKNEIHML